MTPSEYRDRVLAGLRRLTPEEREAVRRELDGHIEDHMEALRELGYDEALAQERTMAAMGDPEEVGRELEKQYPLRWLILGPAGCGGNRGIVHPDDAGSGTVGNGLGQFYCPDLSR